MFYRTVSITTTSTSIFGARRTRSNLRPIPPEPAADDASAEAEPAPAAAPEEPAAPAEEPKPEEPADAAETPAAKTPDFDAPNVNPVELGHVEAPRTPDGKIDPTKIVDPAVAGDWEEQGCKG